MAIQETLQHLGGIQATQAPISTSAPPIVESIFDEPVQGTAPVNIDNLSSARQSASLSKEPIPYKGRNRDHVQARMRKSFHIDIVSRPKAALFWQSNSKTIPSGV